MQGTPHIRLIPRENLAQKAGDFNSFYTNSYYPGKDKENTKF